MAEALESTPFFNDQQIIDSFDSTLDAEFTQWRNLAEGDGFQNPGETSIPGAVARVVQSPPSSNENLHPASIVATADTESIHTQIDSIRKPRRYVPRYIVLNNPGNVKFAKEQYLVITSLVDGGRRDVNNVGKGRVK